MNFWEIPVGSTDSPNSGHGIGRGVREIYRDGSFGRIHFLRYMPHSGYDEERRNPWYPFYKRSPDAGFIEACDALLRDRLYTQQWWEEDRSNDGYYAMAEDNEKGFSCKALSYYHRKDGTAVGIWKDGFAALSTDEGRSWSSPVRLSSMPVHNAKAWGQRTDDGRFAMVYNPMPSGFLRWPLAVITGEDGILFDNMLAVQTEVPPMRFSGRFKDRGPQYVRGILEGNGTPTAGFLPVVYSMNKEDLWISHVPTPVRGRVDQPVTDRFDREDVLDSWNLCCPLWAPVTRMKTDDGRWVLRFTDKEPHDYAKAVRVFPETNRVTIEFSLRFDDLTRGRFEVDVLDHKGDRPVRLIFDHAFLGSGGQSGAPHRAVTIHIIRSPDPREVGVPKLSQVKLDPASRMDGVYRWRVGRGSGGQLPALTTQLFPNEN